MDRREIRGDRLPDRARRKGAKMANNPQKVRCDGRTDSDPDLTGDLWFRPDPLRYTQIQWVFAEIIWP